jgi:hypothetical protein
LRISIGDSKSRTANRKDKQNPDRATAGGRNLGRRRLKKRTQNWNLERTKLRKVLRDFDSKYRSEELCQGDFYQGMRPAPDKARDHSNNRRSPRSSENNERQNKQEIQYAK